MQSFLVKISDYLIQNVFKRIIATRMKIIAYVLRFVTIAITLLIIGEKTLPREQNEKHFAQQETCP